MVAATMERHAILGFLLSILQSLNAISCCAQHCVTEIMRAVDVEMNAAYPSNLKKDPNHDEDSLASTWNHSKLRVFT